MSLRVEDVASKAGLSVDTVRYYRKLGVLHAPRRDGRTAMYDSSHLDRLAEIRRLSSDGFSLAQIRRLIASDSDPRLRALESAESGETKTVDQLAEASGVQRDLVLLAIDAGLIAESPDSPGRYQDDAVTMLSSAAALLDAGLPADALAPIALRHAANISDVIDDAIEVFRRYLPEGTPEEQGQLIAKLVPAASDLVSLHFKRTLIEHASSRLVDNEMLHHVPDDDLDRGVEPTTIYCEWAELSEPLDLVAVGRFARDDHRFLWLQPGDQLGIIAWGEIDSWSPDTGESASTFLSRVRSSMPPTPTPSVVVGGLAFDKDKPTTLAWSKFRNGRLIVPATQIVRRDGRLVAMAFGPDRDRARVRLEHAQTMVEAAQHRGAIELPPLNITIEDKTRDHYKAIVAEAVADINDGRFDKVVLARTIAVNGDVPLGAWLSLLRDRFPTCAVFARGEGSRTFFGASPEVLVRVAGDRVDVAAMAGTRARSDDAAMDDALADELRTSTKEQHEHKLVVESIQANLLAAGVTLDESPPTEVLKLPGIQHLYTPIVGRRDSAKTSIIDLVELLHPTPAVGGTPSETAVEWIRQHENLDRGWYAAPVGWTDMDGNGEFRVGLRSGLHGPDRTLLFAGCGIVGESEPQAELDETFTKFGALLGAIGQ
ncbi:MAG: isochorismate synthase [Actinobacteria bacterium]|nr:isochorismate synthase [Actinomycetota bacterium]